MTKALPCINTQQIAAKSSSKDQQTLIVSRAIIDKSWHNFSLYQLFCYG
jgi:hypothetical protein